MQPDAAGMMSDQSAMNLEINPRHAIIKNLNALRNSDETRAKVICEQLFDNALLAAGLVEDPRLIVNRMNSILEMASK